MRHAVEASMRYIKLNAFLLGAFLLLLFTATAQAGLTAPDFSGLQAGLDAEGATFSVGDNPAANRDISELCGLVPPENWWEGAPFRAMDLRRAALPSYFSWCDLGACPPVRNQGSCGSCWAFGTVGPLESNILIEGGEPTDLSEQYLVSCTTAGSCSGGWWAHHYHQNPGAVPEEDFPYVAADVPCGGPYSHPWQIEEWAYIGYSWSVPSTEEIKEAIMTYGPVAVAVYVGNYFKYYTGGVFNRNESGEVNHAVVLVGWDDNPPEGGDGCWILRNSWGPSWGEGGYMRISYGTSQVGYAANYVVYASDITADFTGEPTQGRTPQTVQFLDQSTGTITSWSWDFGDGDISQEQHPTHTYNAPGAYTVSLCDSGPGGSDTETKSDFVSTTEVPRSSIVSALVPLLIP